MTLGTAASLSPGLVPRPAAVQAVLTGLLVTIGFAVTGTVRALAHRTGRDRRPVRARLLVAAAGVPILVAAVIHAHLWQNRLRAAMGVATPTPWYWLAWAAGATLIVAVLIGGARAVRRSWRRLRRPRGIGLAMVMALAGQAILWPAVTPRGPAPVAAADAAIAPVSTTRSGSAQSAVSWSSLGPEGRKFVAASTSRAVRIYVGLQSAPDPTSRVALALRELERSGGLNRSHLVVAVPTGSGWIDTRAADGLDERFGGDAALVGLQYSQAPSWASFVFGRRTAEHATRALFTAIEQRVSRLEHPPRLYIYGQSLGAVAGNAVFADEADQQRRVCAALWAGPPAGRAHRLGATVLANSSDPVVQWQPELIWRAPDLTGTRPDAPHPPWLPILGYVQTTVDLLTALDPPPGHGHRYGTEQGTAMRGCPASPASPDPHPDF